MLERFVLLWLWGSAVVAGRQLSRAVLEGRGARARSNGE